MDSILSEATNKLQFKKPDLVRFLLNRALMQLKADSIKAKGYENLSFTLRETNGNI